MSDANFRTAEDQYREIAKWRGEQLDLRLDHILSLKARVAALEARVPIVCPTCGGEGRHPHNDLRIGSEWADCPDCQTGATWREGGNDTEPEGL